MTRYLITTLLIAFSSLSFGQQGLIAELKQFEPFIGKTYKGIHANSTPEKPVIDISRWERHLNGNAVRIEHSINDGEYGGETIIFWDKQAQNIRYFYFTTAGFFTEADVSFDGKVMISREKVTGNKNGITEVKAKAWIMEDGSMKTESEYLKNGQWVKGHSAIYTEAPEEKVIFK